MRWKLASSAFAITFADGGPSEIVAQKLWQALTALPIGPPEALRTSSLMSVS